ncbi:MAG TPA: hypothetical protein VIJ75_17195, partial [Hanamia sp.]
GRFVASVRSSQTFGGVIPDCCACYFFYHAKLLAIIFVDKMWLDGRIHCDCRITARLYLWKEEMIFFELFSNKESRITI